VQAIWLAGIAATEDRTRPLADKADPIFLLIPAAEIGAIAIVHQPLRCGG
jgi:hypothetical protein